MLTLHEYALFPALITAAEQTSNPRAEHSAETLLLLADCLYEELAAPRNYQNRRDPRLVHAHVTGGLERSVVRYDQHRRGEIVEAFLLLTGHRNGVLNHILQHARDKAHVTLVRLLSNSPRRGVMRLVLDLFNDPRSPASTHLSPFYLENSVEQTRTPNVVTSILMDYRALDTLVETLVIFTAGIACALLLRKGAR